MNKFSHKNTGQCHTTTFRRNGRLYAAIIRHDRNGHSNTVAVIELTEISDTKHRKD